MVSTHSRHQKNSNRGATAVEGAFAIALLVPLIVGLIDLIRIVFAAASMQYALVLSQRWATFNGTIGTMTRAQSIGWTVIENAKKVGLVLQQSDIQVCNLAVIDSCDSTEGPNDLIKISVSKSIPTVFIGIASGGSRSFSLSVNGIVKNEPASA